MTADIKDFVYTVQETADLLKLSERSIRRYIAQGKLKAYRVAGERKLRIKGQDILQLLEPVDPSDGGVNSNQ
jgi:excisionase family DNA binding protein